MKNASQITIHMVSSLDGFIASKDDDISWMRSTDHYEKGKELTEEEIATFLQSIDCYVMGSRTYEHALQLGWPYGDVPVIVLTSRALTSDRETVEFYSGNLNALVDQVKSRFENIWMVGGSMLTKEFLRQYLADRLVISIMPIILGDGLLFFDFIGSEHRLHLTGATPYKDGMVELSYDIEKRSK